MTPRSTIQLPCSADSVGKARAFAIEALAGLPERDHETVAAVTLLVSELATNSVLHSRSGFDLDIAHEDGSVRVEVTDTGAGVPAPLHPAPTDPHGRGLLIVGAFADEWGVIPSTDHVGKTVWFTLRTNQEPAEADADP